MTINQCESTHSYFGEIINSIVNTTLGLQCANDISEGYAILVTFSAALITGSLAYFMSLRRDLINLANANTDNFILQNNEKLLEDMQKFGEKIFYEDFGAITYEDVNNKIDEWNRIYTHFEKLSVAIKYGFVSEKYVISVERSLILRCFQSSQTIICSNRENFQNRNYLDNYQSLYFRTLFGKKIMWKFAMFLESIPFVEKYAMTNLLLRAEYRLIKFFYDMPDDVLDVDFKDLKMYRKKSYKNILYIFAAIFVVVILSIINHG